jgi:hypothetical protein
LIQAAEEQFKYPQGRTNLMEIKFNQWHANKHKPAAKKPITGWLGSRLSYT